jgi:hypothetical protein
MRERSVFVILAMVVLVVAAVHVWRTYMVAHAQSARPVTLAPAHAKPTDGQ